MVLLFVCLLETEKKLFQILDDDEVLPISTDNTESVAIVSQVLEESGSYVFSPLAMTGLPVLSSTGLPVRSDTDDD